MFSSSIPILISFSSSIPILISFSSSIPILILFSSSIPILILFSSSVLILFSSSIPILILFSSSISYYHSLQFYKLQLRIFHLKFSSLMFSLSILISFLKNQFIWFLCLNIINRCIYVRLRFINYAFINYNHNWFNIKLKIKYFEKVILQKDTLYFFYLFFR